MKANYILLLLLLFNISLIQGQQINDVDQKKKQINKGKFFAHWGWNWASYSDSDIRFKGENYDFVLSDVKARDTPSKFSFKKYFGITNITKPQTNFRIGYFFKENYTVSIGVDHMKYVVLEDQKVTMNGEIGASHALFEGSYINDEQVLSPDFLTYEHTDGLNYINIAIKRYDEVLAYKKFRLGLSEGIEVGGLLPKTNVTLMGSDRNDDFYWSGYGFSAVGGVTLRIYNHFFIQSELKAGFIDMGAVRTTSVSSDKARQNFFFLQGNILFGFSVPLLKRVKLKTESKIK